MKITITEEMREELKYIQDGLDVIRQSGIGRPVRLLRTNIYTHALYLARLVAEAVERASEPDPFGRFVREVEGHLIAEREAGMFPLDITGRIVDAADDLHGAARCCHLEDDMHLAPRLAARAFLLVEAMKGGKE